MTKTHAPNAHTYWDTLAAGLFALYLAVLVWVILLKMQTDLHALGQMQLRSVNLIPFAQPLRVNGRADLSEVWLNAAVFVPFGLYLSVVRPRWRLARMAAVMGGASLAIEVLQYVFAIGTSDVTDLLMNTLGGAAGVLLYRLLAYLLGARAKRFVTVSALVCTVPMLGMIGLLLSANG